MRVLAISAHPDDETLGCGGTLLTHSSRGDEVSWLIVTKAADARWSPEVVRAKEKEVDAVAREFGVARLFWPGLPSTRLADGMLNDVVAAVREAVEAIRPEIVYVVHHGDVNTDHQVVNTATCIVLKAFHMRSLGVRRLLAFECLSSTEAAPPNAARAFLPNVFRDITQVIDKKIELMGLYGTESQPEPMPRAPSSIRALARYRGAAVGVPYAEAFMLVREVD